jgi:hypothetical protein
VAKIESSSPYLFRTSTFAIVEQGETLGLAFFSVEKNDRTPAGGFSVVQCDLDENGKVWNATPCFRRDDFEAACAKATAEAAGHSVFVS